MIFTAFTIFFMAHMLTCFWYLIGENHQYLGNGVVVMGWVERQEDWNVTLVDPHFVEQVTICIQIHEICITIYGFCTKNDEFCINNDDLNTNG